MTSKEDEIYIYMTRRGGKQYQMFCSIVEAINDGKKVRLVKPNGKFDDYTRIDDLKRLREELFGKDTYVR